VNRALLVCVVVAAGACARTGRTAVCESVPREFHDSAREFVYAECEVDRKARLRSGMPVMYSPTGGSSCGRAIIHVVVGSNGLATPGTVKIWRATDPLFARSIIEALSSMRFVPAMRDGRVVPQLFTIDRRYGNIRTTC